MNYVHMLKPKPKRIIINHGEKNKAVEFAKIVANRFRINTSAPRNLDSLRLR